MEEEVLFIKNVNLIIKTNLDNPNLKGNFIAKRLGINRMQLHRKLSLYKRDLYEEHHLHSILVLLCRNYCLTLLLKNF